MKCVLVGFILFYLLSEGNAQDTTRVDTTHVTSSQHKGETPFHIQGKAKNSFRRSESQNIKSIMELYSSNSSEEVREQVQKLEQQPSLQEQLSKQQNMEEFLQGFDIERVEPEPELEEEDIETTGAFKLPAPFDSRIDLNQLDDEIEEQYYILQRTNDIFCVIHKDLLIQIGERVYELDITRKLGAAYNLCEGQPYSEQPSVGIGTAFLIRNNLIITADHVLNQYPLEEYRLIGRYQVINDDGDIRVIFLEDEIYRLEEKVGAIDLDHLDIAAVKLDKPSPFSGSQINQQVEVDVSDQVYALGHPIGLPMKLTINARVKNMDQKYLYTSLDSFQGNSGSPVYRRNTHELVGILVSGGTDFEPFGDCMQSYLCVGPECGQEKVLSINYLLQFLKPHLDR